AVQCHNTNCLFLSHIVQSMSQTDSLPQRDMVRLIT
ncbi:MAG: hypothetical protein ACJASY_003890, partial [Halioglobus sp.]